MPNLRLTLPFSYKFFIICCLLLIVGDSFSRASAQGQAAEVEIKAEAGFGGYVKEGKWIPVHITVQNKGADIDTASLQVSYQANGMTNIFAAEVSLPTNSRKELLIYVYYPQGGASNLSVQLLANERVVSKTSVRISNLAAESLIIGLLTKTPSKYSELSRITPLNGITRLVELQAQDLPEKAQGWEALDALFISDTDTGVLSSAQLAALELWVAKGGTLLTVGGSNWQATTQGLRNLLPLEVTGTATISGALDTHRLNSELTSLEIFDPEAATLLALGKLQPDAQTLTMQGDQALVIQKKIGRGKSIFFAADPGMNPYKNWNGTYYIYDALLSSKARQPFWADNRWESNSTDRALSSIKELTIPSIFLICGLLGFYIVLIGPLNYIFLRIIKRREWAWVTIPALVILVSFASYIYGYFYRGTTPTLNRLTVIQAWDGVRQAESASLVGIYSPQRTTYTLETNDPGLLFPYKSNELTLQNDTAWFSTQMGASQAVAGIPIEIGGMKAIGATSVTAPLEIEHDLTLAFRTGDPVLSGSISNHSDQTIYNVSLVTPGFWKSLGDFAPGETKKITLPISSLPGGPSFFSADSAAILQTTTAQIQKDPDLRRKENFLLSITRPEYGQVNDDWGIYLVGWLETPQTSATLKGKNAKVVDTTLYIHQLTPKVSTPPALPFTITSSVMEWQSDSAEVSPYSIHIYNNADFQFSFKPAFPIQFSGVTKLTLTLNGNSLINTIEFSLWDYTLNGWSPLTNVVAWGTVNIPKPERYVNPAGVISLRIKDQTSGYIEMDLVAISLTVKP